MTLAGYERPLFSLTVAIAVLFGPLASHSSRAADMNRAGRLDEQREDAAVRKAQQELQQAQQSLLKTQAAFRAAQAERKATGIGLQKTIDRLEEELALSVGLIADRSQLKQAREAFNQEATPILRSVQQTAEYQAAEKDLAAATAALEPEKEGDREEAAGKAAAARATMRNLEQAGTDAAPHLKPLKAEIIAAEAKLEATQARFEKAVEQDADLKKVRNAFAVATLAEEKAGAALVQSNRELLAARARLARAHQAIQTKRAADQKDANKPEPKKKAKPKGK